jgi:hypothetical protein
MPGGADGPVARVEQTAKEPREQEEQLHAEVVDGNEEKVKNVGPPRVLHGPERHRVPGIREGGVEQHAEEHREAA